jgi:hypothetical protein
VVLLMVGHHLRLRDHLHREDAARGAIFDELHLQSWRHQGVIKGSSMGHHQAHLTLPKVPMPKIRCSIRSSARTCGEEGRRGEHLHAWGARVLDEVLGTPRTSCAAARLRTSEMGPMQSTKLVWSRYAHRHVLEMTNASKSRAEPSSRDFSPDDGDHQGVIRASSGGHQCVIRVSSGCHQGVIRVSSGRHQGVIRVSSGCHQGVIRASSGCHQGVIRVSSGCHQGVISASSVRHQCVISASSVRHQCVIRRHQGSSEVQLRLLT